MPPQVRRGFYAGGLPVPEGKDQLYRASFAAMMAMVKALHDAGIPIVAGTDAWPASRCIASSSSTSQAGIPAPEVLRIATLGAARVMKHDDELRIDRAGQARGPHPRRRRSDREHQRRAQDIAGGEKWNHVPAQRDLRGAGGEAVVTRQARAAHARGLRAGRACNDLPVTIHPPSPRNEEPESERRDRERAFVGRGRRHEAAQVEAREHDDHGP